MGAADRPHPAGEHRGRVLRLRHAWGPAELDNLANDERIAPALEMLLGTIINGELRAELPPYLRAPQAISKGAYLAYEALLVNLPAPNSEPGFRPDLVGYGRDF